MNYQFDFYTGDPVCVDSEDYDEWESLLSDLGVLLADARAFISTGFKDSDASALQQAFDEWARPFVADWLAFVKSYELKGDWHLSGNSNKQYKHWNASMNRLNKHNAARGRRGDELRSRVGSFRLKMRGKFDYTPPPPPPVVELIKPKRGRLSKTMQAMGWFSEPGGRAERYWQGGQDAISPVPSEDGGSFLWSRRDKQFKDSYKEFTKWADVVAFCEADCSK